MITRLSSLILILVCWESRTRLLGNYLYWDYKNIYIFLKFLNYLTFGKNGALHHIPFSWSSYLWPLSTLNVYMNINTPIGTHHTTYLQVLYMNKSCQNETCLSGYTLFGWASSPHLNLPLIYTRQFTLNLPSISLIIISTWQASNNSMKSQVKPLIF